VLWIDYQDYMESDEMLLEAVRYLSIYGLVFLRKVPENSRQNSVEGIAKRIGNIKETFYGRTWDVKSVKDAKNIAFVLHISSYINTSLIIAQLHSPQSWPPHGPPLF
jgi:gamma-butyrobetaine dioxygenase